MDAIKEGLVDLVINIPIEYNELGRPDGYHIRRQAVDAGIPLITDLQRAQAIIEALRHRKVKDPPILSWDEYAARRLVTLSRLGAQELTTSGSAVRRKCSGIRLFSHRTRSTSSTSPRTREQFSIFVQSLGRRNGADR
jgi:hypothetical protein